MKKLPFILLCLLCVGVIQATTRYVDLLRSTDSSQNIYHTITEAYNAAVSGDEIVIYPGNYFESLTINKVLSIRGNTQDKTRIYTNGRIGFQINSGPVLIENLAFKAKGSDGIKFTNTTSSHTVRNCLFEGCSNGIESAVNINLTVENCIFRANTCGIYLTNNNVYGYVKNCIFLSNSTGIYISYSDAYMDVFNNIFISNTTKGLCNSSNGSYFGSLSYNLFYNNTTNTSGINVAEGNIFDIDPLLTNTSGDPYFNYFPTSGSPCIDTGNPDINYNDLDGSRCDIGIFGGPHPWGEGKPVVLDIQVTPNAVEPGGTIEIQASGQVK